MKKEILYLDQWDFSKEPYGSGGGPLIKSSLKYCSNIFIYAGFTSNKNDILCVEKSLPFYNNQKGIFISFKENRNIIPDSLKFIFGLFLFYKNIKIYSNIFTRSYIVVWFLYFAKYKGNIYYYIPGLSNPWMIGKYPKIGLLLSSIFNYIQSKSLNKCTVIMAAASQDVIKKTVDHYKVFGFKKEIHYLPEGVDTCFFNTEDINISREQFNLPLSYTIFSFIGRLAKVKGVDFIINSFNEYLKINPKSILVIVGNGEEELHLKNHVKKINLSDKVLFMGIMSSSNVRNIICSSNACLFGSHNEGFSFSMLEILSCGRPIVTTNVSGTKELIIENKTGFVINERNCCLFSKKMELITKKDSDIWSISTRNHIIENYSDELQWFRINELCKIKEY